jgi:hypothetical protein
MRITHDQAIAAVQILVDIVEQVDERDERQMATQVNLSPQVFQQIRDVVKNINANE